MRAIIYDCVEHEFLEVNVKLLDGFARSGQHVLFDDGTISFCCEADYEKKTSTGEPMMRVFDVGFVTDEKISNLDLDELESFRNDRRYSTIEVSVFDARPCKFKSVE